jgi:hypothetical protein
VCDNKHVTNFHIHILFIYIFRDHSIVKGDEISIQSLYALNKREVKPSYMGTKLHLKSKTTGKSVPDAMDIVYSVYDHSIPYLALSGPNIGVVVAVEAALHAFSSLGNESVLFLDYADAKLRPQKLSRGPLGVETSFKALFIGIRNGNLSAHLFMGLVASMTTSMTEQVFNSIHQQMTNKNYVIPSPPVVVIDGALTLLQTVIHMYTPYKEMGDYMICSMKGLFDEFHTDIVTNPLVKDKNYTFILRCYFNFKHQILRHFKSSKSFKCPPEVRRKYQLLSELLFDSFYCGRTIEEMIATMVSMYSLLRSKTIRVVRGEGPWRVDWEIDLECLHEICWKDDDLNRHMKEHFIGGRSAPQLTSLFVVSIENIEDGGFHLVFDAATAKDENKKYQRRYNKTATDAKITDTHRRHKVKFPVVGLDESSVLEAEVENSIYSEATAQYFLLHVFKWWLLICEAAKEER